MKYADDLSAALHAAEDALEHLETAGVLLVTEIGEYGVQIAMSDDIDHLALRSTLRGVADRLDGRDTPLLAVIFAELKARGWEQLGASHWRHRETNRAYETLSEVLLAQCALEIARTGPPYEEKIVP